MLFMIVLICITLVVAILSTQNAQPVSISVFAWSFEASLAIIMFLSAVFGLVIGFMSSFVFRASRKRKRMCGHQPMMPGRIEP
jgi:uncharacterized integral membrane protein